MELLIREKLLAALLALYIALLILDPSLLRRSPWLLKPDTLCSLATLFIASRAAELSGLFSRVSVAIVRRFAEMPFALYSVLILSAGLTAMLITNDAALFIYLPLVASIESVWGVDLLSLYVVTTISVNVLSALTPIGNPQNLFLWQHYALGFAEFVVGLAPFTGVATAILLIYALTLATRIERCSKPPPPPPVRVNRILAASSVAMLAALVALTHLGVSWAALPLAVALSVAVSPTVLKGLDIPLLAVFALMFLDFGELATLLHNLLNPLLTSPQITMLVAVVLSQAISNVPAAIILSSAPRKLWRYIAIGVNLGGTGFILGSLANLILLRLTRVGLRDYHRYTLPYFITLLILTLLLSSAGV